SDVAPEYFGTPLDAIYSTFRICTVEGWYDIPDSITSVYPGWGNWIRLYFIFIVTAGGIIGLSLVNSIFVDAMVSDNNDELTDKVDELTKKIEELSEKLDKLQK
ncbi:MAG: hypothetical protein MJZ16_07385, partial [Bacteroidales bacterium]|nr:hypothetical protein [Bacteroidales bacterium]